MTKSRLSLCVVVYFLVSVVCTTILESSFLFPKKTDYRGSLVFPHLSEITEHFWSPEQTKDERLFRDDAPRLDDGLTDNSISF